MRKSKGKMVITRRALTQRINRRLAANGERLKAYRGAGRTEGSYYIIDIERNAVKREHIRDLEKLGRELGALDPWEVLEEEGGDRR